jgi:hypothetical protein
MIAKAVILIFPILALIFIGDNCMAFVPIRTNALLSWYHSNVLQKPSHRGCSSAYIAKVCYRNQRSSTKLNYSNTDFNGFRNITSSNDVISRTSSILAKRIVHRGFATMGLQLRRQRDKQKLDIEKENQRVESAKKNLDLKWSIAQSNNDCDTGDLLSCSEPCETCRGKGVVFCQFCQGNGYVDFGHQMKGTVGGAMELKNGGHTGIECPVCNEDGEQGCGQCNGSGWIANWKKK